MVNLRGKLVVAQSGGPTAVFNNSACGVIQEALKHDVFEEVYGAANGIMGILHENLIDLKKESPETIDGLRRTPASTLGTCRRKLDETDLERAIKSDNVEAVREAIESGTPIDALDEHGRTMLENAAIQNSANVLRYLCEQGAELRNALALAQENAEFFPEHRRTVELLQSFRTKR